jgi:hypothetical protein
VNDGVAMSHRRHYVELLTVWLEATDPLPVYRLFVILLHHYWWPRVVLVVAFVAATCWKCIEVRNSGWFSKVECKQMAPVRIIQTKFACISEDQQNGFFAHLVRFICFSSVPNLGGHHA